MTQEFTAKKNPHVTIALDVMGGDHGPPELVKGAVQAAQTTGCKIILVGDLDKVKRELTGHDFDDQLVTIVPSEGFISEGLAPIQSLRENPRASVAVAGGLVKAGKADAFVTMGSTGAALAVATMSMGMLDGIDRPAVGGPIIGLAPNTLVIDLGTNIDCRPTQLLGFAIVGMMFAKIVFEISNPRIGLLSVGSEEGKGGKQVKETYELLSASNLNFIGNVEGWDIPAGKADVVVCDGAVGNILMKYTEGLGVELSNYLGTKVGQGCSKESLDDFKKEVLQITNPAESSGGGPIFGVDGVAVVGHGRFRASAVSRAVETAMSVVKMEYIDKLKAELKQFKDVMRT